MTYDWEELRGLTLARQFPEVAGGGPAAVAATVDRMGPIQSQTARSPYAALGARLPGVTHADITAAYESWSIVRGSSIRGTVHTSTAAHHALLDATTRVGNRTLWARMLRLEHHELEEVWSEIEEFAADAWRTPAELLTFLTTWLADHDEPEAVRRLDHEAGRYLAFGHGGLLRRPLAGEWSGQGASGYRTATAVLPAQHSPDHPVLDAVRTHLASYGPASRYDVAWWSGLGLRQVDAHLERLDLTWRDGPDGRAYADLPSAVPARDLPGVRLLPEFDAVLCGYDPRARGRFVAPADNEVLWHRTNGLMLAPVLVDGRVGGYWRLTGPARAKNLQVTLFPGARRPRRAELDEATTALSAALDLPVVSGAVDRSSA